MKDNNTQYRITDRESLNLLLTRRKKRFGKLIMDVENMDETKAKNFETDLNKFHTSCGCTTGNYFLTTAMVLCFLYIYISGQTIANWKIIMQGFVFLLFVAFIGKLTGKLIDGLKFKKTVEKLKHELV